MLNYPCLLVLTTVGSLGASLLSAPLSPLIMRFFPRFLDITRAVLEGAGTSSSSGSESDGKEISPATTHPSGVWVRLSVLRLVGVVPWSGINIACGVCGVPMWDCMLGSFIGTLPWTAVTCQVCFNNAHISLTIPYLYLIYRLGTYCKRLPMLLQLRLRQYRHY